MGNVCQGDGSCSAGITLTLQDDTCSRCTCDSRWGIGCVYPVIGACPCNVWGRVKFVDAFEDISVKFVESFPDLEVTMVTGTPQGPGEWEEVEAFETIKIKVVDSFPDLEVQLVTNPSNDCP